MTKPFDHDIRAWLTAELYLGAIHAAEADDRTLSGYIRNLVRKDLASRALTLAHEQARAETGFGRDKPGRELG